MTADEAEKTFRYDSETGLLYWRIRPSNGVREGQKAGSDDGDGYLQVRYRGRTYKAHRIVWLIHKGEMPVAMIDHINGIRSDNRIENLREANATANAQNRRGASSDNKSGLLGVSPYRNKWAAQIMTRGCLHRIGLFGTPEEAHSAYLKAKSELHASQN